MYHSITIGDKNTWDDWHLIPKSRPLFVPPEVKTEFVEVPGGNGAIDLTGVLTGRPTYKNRSGSWEFYVENGFKDWTVLYSEIMTYLHGRSYKAILEDDPDYYYEGRFSVNTWKSDPHWSLITIDYNVGPYKKSRIAAGRDWLWDTFNFETDTIQHYEDLPVDGMLEVYVIGDSMPVSPTIIVSTEGMTVVYEGETYTLKKGANYLSELTLKEGMNEFAFTGTGTVSMKYERGRL